MSGAVYGGAAGAGAIYGRKRAWIGVDRAAGGSGVGMTARGSSIREFNWMR